VSNKDNGEALCFLLLIVLALYSLYFSTDAI